MRTYHVRYIHKISPRDTDVGEATLPDTAFADRKTLAQSLRRAGVLLKGCSIREMRVSGDKIVVFPTCPGMSTYWRAIILTAD